MPRSMDFLILLNKVAPKAAASEKQSIAKALSKYAANYGLNTEKRITAFLAQLAHESDGFKTRTEYASGAAYEGRKDLGNTSPGDGKKYKGRGYIQLTGRSNYTAASNQLYGDNRLVKTPEAVSSSADAALLVSLWYWKKNNLNAYADKGDFVGLTKKINGGTNGLSSRNKYLSLAKDAWVQASQFFSANPIKSGIVFFSLVSLALWRLIKR